MVDATTHLGGLAPGQLVGGKYRLEKALAAGGTAVVFEAVHTGLNQRVALKMLRGDGARAPEVVERFHREAQIAAQLPADHVARVTDLGWTDAGEPYLVMELLIGHDLEAEIRMRGAVPFAEAVDYVLQACEGIAEAHAAGLVHRDLKPANLFLSRRRDGSPIIKVLDFGISKGVRGAGQVSLTATASNFGTPLYMSPEQIESTKHVDARCDQHALGMILYALVTGRPPFAAPSVTAISIAIATQPPPSARAFAPNVPPELDAALMRAMAKRPQDRFPDIAAFARAIAPFGAATAEASVRSIERALASPRCELTPGARPAGAAKGGIPNNGRRAPRPSGDLDESTLPLAAGGPAIAASAPAGSRAVEPAVRRALAALAVVGAAGAIALGLLRLRAAFVSAPPTGAAPGNAPTPALAEPPSPALSADPAPTMPTAAGSDAVSPAPTDSADPGTAASAPLPSATQASRSPTRRAHAAEPAPEASGGRSGESRRPSDRSKTATPGVEQFFER